MLATETAATPYMPPLPAALAILPTPELMAIVMRRIGEGCGIDDFREAAETCDLSEAKLRANLGAAKRILLVESERQVFPARPLAPWDADPSYRKELVQQAGRVFALGYADPALMIAALARAGFEPEAMIALWDEFVTEGISQLHRLPRLGLLSGIVADLDAAVAAYDTGDLNAEASNLVHTLRSAIDGLRNDEPLPRRIVLRTIEAFAAVEKWSSFDAPHRAKVESALTTLRTLWGL